MMEIAARFIFYDVYRNSNTNLDGARRFLPPISNFIKILSGIESSPLCCLYRLNSFLPHVAFIFQQYSELWNGAAYVCPRVQI